MYPFESIVPAWERLWSLVHERAAWTPPVLRWDGDPHDHCRDPRCLVAQGCGWPAVNGPAVNGLRHLVTIVGAFTLALPDADGHRYRSVLVANRPIDAEELAAGQLTAAANVDDSLSGWISLLAATVGAGNHWTGRVEWTGAHVDSIRAVRDGVADVAAIDALTLAYLRRDQPDAVGWLVEVGRGPWIPSPPVVVRRDTTRPGQVEELRTAFVAALDDPASADLRAELLLDGFTVREDADYEPILALGPRR